MPETPDCASALARARDEVEHEGRIAGMADAAAIVHAAYRLNHSDDGSEALLSIEDDILTELRRRYGAGNPRVVHHLRLRGLE